METSFSRCLVRIEISFCQLNMRVHLFYHNLNEDRNGGGDGNYRCLSVHEVRSFHLTSTEWLVQKDCAWQLVSQLHGKGIPCSVLHYA